MDAIVSIKLLIVILFLKIKFLPNLVGFLFSLIVFLFQIALAFLLIPIIGELLFMGVDIKKMLFFCY